MIAELQKSINDSYYWDARVKLLDCKYFGDEVKLVFEDGQRDITYHFQECYSIKIEHSFGYPKSNPSQELSLSQIPYFMQDLELREVIIDDKRYLKFMINMFPIELYIVCENRVLPMVWQKIAGFET